MGLIFFNQNLFIKMKKLFLLSIALLFVGYLGAQAIKGPESISYFQAPAEGVKFEKADVYLLADEALQKAKRETQKEKNMAMGSKFGGLGEAVAKTANNVIDYGAKVSAAIKAFQDDEGRFAVWNFVPNYIIAEPEIKSNVIVEIYVLNEEDPSPSAGMTPLKPDKEGYYDIPYYINCRYKVTTRQGEVLLEDNLGVLSGTRKSKNYTPPAEGSGGIGTVTVEESDELTESEKIGINVAYNRARQEVFARFGFGVFDSPIKLGKLRKIKEAKKLTDDILDIFIKKQGLLLNKEEKAIVQNFVDIIEKNQGAVKDKNKWVVYHNLSVCYAWLENTAKANESYEKYTNEISESIEAITKWNKYLAGTLPKEERKGLFVNGKDMKKYTNYRDIQTFVKFYPKGVNKYSKLFRTLNRDLAKFVDFYAYNDLLCQLYEIDYPFQFFPLQGFAGEPKKMEGSITKEGMEPINFHAKFDRFRRIKQIETEQKSIGDDGSKEKLYSRKLMPLYDKETGKYLAIETNAGIWQQQMASNIYFSGRLNDIYDPIEKATYATANNITKNAGIFAAKTSDEKVRLKVDLDGKIYFKGNSEYFKANAIFKEMLQANGIEVSRTNTTSDFTTFADINDEGVFTTYSWLGSVNTRLGTELAPKGSLSADKLKREILILEQDEHGNPTKVQYNFEMNGSLDMKQRMSVKEWFAEGYAQGHTPDTKFSSEGFELKTQLTWDCSFTYDDQGNWTEMKVGPYTATRTFKY